MRIHLILNFSIFTFIVNGILTGFILVRRAISNSSFGGFGLWVGTSMFQPFLKIVVGFLFWLKKWKENYTTT